MAELSDQAWADICAAAGRTPDAGAHAELSKILFDDYPAFAYDREHWAKAFRLSQRMLKQIEAFAVNYRTLFPVAVDVSTEHDLWCIDGLQRRTRAIWLVTQTIRRANAGRRSVQRELLYHWLCNLWLDRFHGELTYSRPSLGGPPCGPLIAFILAAFRHVLALPSAEAVSDAVARERTERENCRQVILQLQTQMGV
jgi:hypothetical protein